MAHKIIFIVGARPNFMKIAPLMRECQKFDSIEPFLVHTGQHYEERLSGVFFRELGIPEPDVNLGVGSFPREEQIEKIKQAFLPVLEVQKPELVVVVGDVNSTLACAELAVSKGIKVAHVEAGLRSFDLGMPEEQNRIATDAISDFLFVTEPAGMKNLEKESLAGEAFLVGNVMIDSLCGHLERADASELISELSLSKKEFILTTFHRPSNVDSKPALLRILSALSFLASKLPLVLPLHPRTKASLEKYQLREEFEAIKGLHLVEPLSYLNFIGMLKSAFAVVTDSGGIQEEASFLKIPCLTMRTSTERPITISHGSNILVGEDLGLLKSEFEKILAGQAKKVELPGYWDGKAAERILEQVLHSLLNLGQPGF